MSKSIDWFIWNFGTTIALKHFYEYKPKVHIKKTVYIKRKDTISLTKNL